MNFDLNNINSQITAKENNLIIYINNIKEYINNIITTENININNPKFPVLNNRFIELEKILSTIPTGEEKNTILENINNIQIQLQYPGNITNDIVDMINLNMSNINNQITIYNNRIDTVNEYIESELIAFGTLLQYTDPNTGSIWAMNPNLSNIQNLLQNILEQYNLLKKELINLKEYINQFFIEFKGAITQLNIAPVSTASPTAMPATASAPVSQSDTYTIYLNNLNNEIYMYLCILDILHDFWDRKRVFKGGGKKIYKGGLNENMINEYYKIQLQTLPIYINDNFYNKFYELYNVIKNPENIDSFVDIFLNFIKIYFYDESNIKSIIKPEYLDLIIQNPLIKIDTEISILAILINLIFIEHLNVPNVDSKVLAQIYIFIQNIYNANYLGNTQFFMEYYSKYDVFNLVGLFLEQDWYKTAELTGLKVSIDLYYQTMNFIEDIDINEEFLGWEQYMQQELSTPPQGFEPAQPYINSDILDNLTAEDLDEVSNMNDDDSKLWSFVGGKKNKANKKKNITKKKKIKKRKNIMEEII